MEYLMTLNVMGSKELKDRLKNIYVSFNQELLNATKLWIKLVERHIKQDKLSGQVLNIRSGLLRASIFGDVIMIPAQRWFAYILSDRDYAAAQEFGAVIKIPRHRKNGPQIINKLSRKKVKSGNEDYYIVEIPERSYIRSTVTEDEPLLLEYIINRFDALIRAQAGA